MTLLTPKPESIQQKIVALCQNRFFNFDHVSYEDFLIFQKIHSLYCFLFLFLSGLKCCPSLLNSIGIPVLSRNFRNSSLFTAICKNSPSAGSVSAANFVRKHVDIFRKPITFPKNSVLICDTSSQLIHFLCRILGFSSSTLFIFFIFEFPCITSL